MLTEEQLNHIVTHPDDVSHQVVAMAKELLAYRAAFARPYAVIEPLGMTYIGDEMQPWSGTQNMVKTAIHACISNP